MPEDGMFHTVCSLHAQTDGEPARLIDVTIVWFIYVVVRTLSRIDASKFDM